MSREKVIKEKVLRGERKTENIQGKKQVGDKKMPQNAQRVRDIAR